MFCSKCGKNNELEAKFCQSCGTKLESPGYSGNSGINNDLKFTGPEGIELASLGSRIGAYLIDTVIIFVLCFGIGLVIGLILLGTGDAQSVNDDSLFLLNYLIGFMVLFGYFLVLEGPLGKGRTIGKRILNLRVLKEDQSTIGYGASFGRNILRLIDGFFFYIIGMILISDSDLNQRLGDRAAHTIVIKEN